MLHIDYVLSLYNCNKKFRSRMGLGLEVPPGILLLHNSLDSRELSFANDPHFGTHTTLITVCFVL